MGVPRSQTSVGWEVTQDRGKNSASRLPLFSRSVPSTFCDAMDCTRQTPWDFPGKNTAVGCHSLLQGSSRLRIEPASPALAGIFFTTEPPGKPREGAVKTTPPIPTQVPLKFPILQTQAPTVTPSLLSSQAVLHSRGWWGRLRRGWFLVVGIF